MDLNNVMNQQLPKKREHKPQWLRIRSDRIESLGVCVKLLRCEDENAVIYIITCRRLLLYYLTHKIGERSQISLVGIDLKLIGVQSHRVF